MTDQELLIHAANALDRCLTILGNMAMENEGAIFRRWPINHEPLRADARGVLPVLHAVYDEINQHLGRVPAPSAETN